MRARRASLPKNGSGCVISSSRPAPHASAHHGARASPQVRDILKSRLAVLKAVSERDERSRLRGELIRCEGRLWLLELLQSGCMQLPIITIEVGGQEIRADRRWNQGLLDPEVRLEGGREPQTVDEERHCGRFCYYCASLTPPVRVQHRMVDCPKRRRANAREYLPEVMAEARAELKRMRQAAEEKLALHRKASEEVRVQKQTLLELAGAIKVLGTQVQRSGLLIALDCYLIAT